jgi:hypothetical protein
VEAPPEVSVTKKREHVAPTYTGDETRDTLIHRMNSEYAFVLLGDRPVVMHEIEGADGRQEIRLLTVSGFHEWLKPRTLQHGDKRIQASKLWIESLDRREYKGLVFDPSSKAAPAYYNLWRGYAVEPNAKAGSCQRFLDHIAENVCHGDDALFSWVMGWFAAMVQYPTEKLGTALVLRGGQGTGKTIVGRIIGSLLGPHYSLVADSRYIVGRFNSHLANCLLLQLDEATWGGDHAAAGKLKDLITGDWQYIEYKGKEPVRVQNYVRLLVTGNNNWLVPAGVDERRFAVLDVSEAKQQNHAYFQAIEDEMEAGGREALLAYLLSMDLSDIPLRSIPETAALREQKISTLPPEQQWWLDILGRGQLPGDQMGTGESLCTRLFGNYLTLMKELGVNRRQSETAFGITLRRMVPNVKRSRRRIAGPGGTQLHWYYRFPSLAECRQQIVRLVGETDFAADSPETWTPEQEDQK